MLFILEHHRKDPDLAALIQYIESGTVPDDTHCTRTRHPELHLRGRSNKTLWLAILWSLQQNILTESHSSPFSGHFALCGLYKKLVRQYWWPRMYSDVYHHCRSCLTCASYNGSGRRHHPPLKPLPVGAPFERLGINVMEMPLTPEGNHYVVVMTDYLSGWKLVLYLISPVKH